MNASAVSKVKAARKKWASVIASLVASRLTMFNDVAGASYDGEPEWA
jgi:hypothetical protein